MSLPRVGAAVAAVATVLLGAVVTAAPASAGQPGGCNPGTRGPFTFSACVNQPNVSTIQSDGYITAKPSGCFQIRIDIRDKYGNMAKQGDWQTACNTGHFNGASLGFWDFNHNSPWYSEFTIVQGGNSYVIPSPGIG